MTRSKGCVAFICVQNAGRSQMAAAYAERKVDEEGLPIEVISGGTDPADSVHNVVVEAMTEEGFDLSGCEPRTVDPGELKNCDYVITMGCSATGVCPATWDGTDRDWDLDDPAESEIEEVREIRDDVRDRVRSLLDEIMEKLIKEQ